MHPVVCHYPAMQRTNHPSVVLARCMQFISANAAELCVLCVRDLGASRRLSASWASYLTIPMQIRLSFLYISGRLSIQPQPSASLFPESATQIASLAAVGSR